MFINLLCDNLNSWIIPYLLEIKDELESKGHKVLYVKNQMDIEESELTFILGCEKLVEKNILLKSKHNLVIHESDLPHGKGWSPITWQILEGKNSIVVTLFEAAEGVDEGDIYLQEKILLQGNELLDEIKDYQGKATKSLILNYVNQYPIIEGKMQEGESTYYSRRRPCNSELDIEKTIQEQFQLLRVVDNERYPAYFMKDGIKYILKIYKEK